MAAIDRAGITADLSYRYELLLAQAGIAATDTTGTTLKPVLDQVQRIADANADLSGDTLTTLARYLLLDRIVERLGTQFDVATSGDSYKLNQLYTNAKQLKESLESVIGWLALGDLTGAAAGQLVTITAPYLNDPHEEGASWF